MAERSTAKAKRRDAARNTVKAQTSASSKKSASSNASRGSSSELSLAGRDLSEENARLKSELAAAQQRIADLEIRHAEVANRIDWVLESLHNLPE